MQKKISYLILFFLFFGTCFLTGNSKKDIHYFIKRAWKYDPRIREAEKKVDYYRSFKTEALANYLPKLNTLAYMAPLYDVQKGNSDDYRYDYSISDWSSWGPYFHLETRLQQAITAFGRIIQGYQAAELGIKAEKYNKETVLWAVAKEVRTYYYGIIFAKTMMKTIKLADDSLKSALKVAEELYAKAEGGITDIDISKLKYFLSQVDVYRSMADVKLIQAQKALAMTTGEHIKLDEFSGKLVKEELDFQDFDHYLKIMLKERPELNRLEAGIKATTKLITVEAMAAAPVLFFAFQADLNYSTVRNHVINPYLNNQFNGAQPGVAVGLLWDLDVALAIAKSQRAIADRDALVELQAFAKNGLPVELEKTYLDMRDKEVNITANKNAIDAAEIWLLSAGAGLEFGAVEAKDLLEGLAALVDSRLKYYQAIYDYNQLIGELCRIVGVDITQQ